MKAECMDRSVEGTLERGLPQSEAYYSGSGTAQYQPQPQTQQPQPQERQHRQQQHPSMTPEQARQIATDQALAVYLRHIEIEQYMRHLQQSTEWLRQRMWEAQQQEMTRNRQWLRPPVWAFHPELSGGD
jgi:hypothetical protein